MSCMLLLIITAIFMDWNIANSFVNEEGEWDGGDESKMDFYFSDSAVADLLNTDPNDRTPALMFAAAGQGSTDPAAIDQTSVT